MAGHLNARVRLVSRWEKARAEGTAPKPRLNCSRIRPASRRATKLNPLALAARLVLRINVAQEHRAVAAATAFQRGAERRLSQRYSRSDFPEIP
jgi:hypothetical protein